MARTSGRRTARKRVTQAASACQRRVKPLHAPALGMPLHSRYRRRSRSARVSSDGLGRVAGALLALFFAPVLLDACGSFLLLACVGCGAASEQAMTRASAAMAQCAGARRPYAVREKRCKPDIFGFREKKGTVFWPRTSCRAGTRHGIRAIPDEAWRCTIDRFCMVQDARRQPFQLPAQVEPVPHCV